MKIFETKDALETMRLAENMVRILPSDVHVIVLEGILGAGKTTFTKGIAKALGITRPVNSPTYIILKIYEGVKRLYHLDLYRLDEEGFDFDLEEYLNDKNALSVVEWAEKVPSLMPKKYIKVRIDYVEAQKRKISIESIGMRDAWEVKLSKLYF